VEVDILGKITGQFLAHKSSPIRSLDLSRRVGHGDIWQRKWERLEQGEHNKPSGCSASGAYAPGPDYEKEEDAGEFYTLRSRKDSLFYNL
jgi:hypothetical protein